MNRALMMKFGLLLVALGLCGLPGYGAISQHPTPPAAPQPAATMESKATAGQQPAGAAQAEAHYVLTPERRAKAITYSRAQYLLYFADIALSLAIYGFFWRIGLAVVLREWVRRVSARRFVQCVLFAPLFLAAVRVLEFPLDYFWGFTLEHRYDLSTQRFGSWMADWAKGLGLTAVAGIILVWVFYWLVRRSPRRWWLYFWLASIPITLAFILIEPYVVEPLFYRFTPLEKTQPALTDRIEKMLGHAGLTIPRSRIYEMNASAKTRLVNAYVSGLGSSKRVVVWDTTLEKLNSDQTLLVLGHEAGHYVLHHIPKEFALDETLFLVLFYVGFLLINRIVGRENATTCHSEPFTVIPSEARNLALPVQGKLREESRTSLRFQSEIPRFARNDIRTGVEGVGDLASLPIVLLVLTVLVFVASPAINGISRHYEHQADQFGLEVAYGIVADPNTADVQSFQTLGEEDLEDPDPNPFVRFWLYTHPPLEERIRFAASYRPWAEGKPLEFVPTPRE
ncbi:MAG: M48 family metallopeptidase [Terriglobia bacterium]|jgi:Zn-dependent protease with chaperone function